MYDKRILLCISIFILGFQSNFGQNITLYEQLNGRYDFTFLGNSMNLQENNTSFFPVTVSESSATLSLDPNSSIIKAYLYWAGSGDGDFQVNLNNLSIQAERQFNFSNELPDGIELTFFGAFADVTSIVTTTGNGIYTVSDLDISSFEALHREARRTNFAGWALLIVYENQTLPFNQLNIYDGFEDLIVPFVDGNDSVTIQLNNLNVLDNQGAKIGFLAWEGDSLLDIRESLKFNGEVLSNSQNPPTNAFNSSNTYGSPSLIPNMDMDSYQLENYLEIGDDSATIEISSGRDFVIIHSIVTKLNNQLPDASITIDSVTKTCESRVIAVDFSVLNMASTDTLPAGIPISIYLNGVFFDVTETTVPVLVNGEWNASLTLEIPESYGMQFEITLKVDDNNGLSIQKELNEDNNTVVVPVAFFTLPTFNTVSPITSCNLGLSSGQFDFSSYASTIPTDTNDEVSFYLSMEDAQTANNPILNTQSFVANTTPAEIYVRVQGENCPAFTSFTLQTKNCPPTVYNYVSANQDGTNDFFQIDGLRDIFLDFRIEIYSRWGQLLWTGGQKDPDWDGYVKNGFNSVEATDGTYFYVLYLNDPDYPKPLTGYLYLNR